MKKQILYFSFLIGIGFLTACAQGPVSGPGLGDHVENPSADTIINVVEYRLDQPFVGKDIPLGDGARNAHNFQKRNIHRGRSIPVRIEVENKSNSGVTLEKLNIGGMDSCHFVMDDAALLTWIKPNQKTYFDLYFVPTQTGLKQAQVSFYVTSDEDHSPRFFYFNLSGIGTDKTLYVSPFGDDSKSGLDANHPQKTIQHAVDTVVAQSNQPDAIDTILLDTGEYKEQIVIPASLAIVGKKDAQDRIIIKAPDPLRRIPDANGQKDVISIVGNGSAQSVQAEIAFVTVKGSVTGGDSCQPLEQGGNILSGIRVRDQAFGYIHDNSISSIRATEMQGCQNGIGVLVGHYRHEARPEQKTPGFAVVLGNELEDYQKAGIAVVGQGSVATVLSNRVKGYGPRPQIAQNGIQMNGGAIGIIEGNDISGNECDQSDNCGQDPYTKSQGSGILLSEYAGKIVVSRNVVSENDLGFSTQMANAPVTNQVQVKVERNFFVDSRRVNVYVEQSDILFSQNQMMNSPRGVLVITDPKRVDQVVTFLKNDILQNGVGMEVNDGDALPNNSNAVVVVLGNNNIMGSATAGVYNQSTRPVDARNNYWGNATGPGSFLGSAATGMGDKVSTKVIFAPFSTTKINLLDIPPVSN